MLIDQILVQQNDQLIYLAAMKVTIFEVRNKNTVADVVNIQNLNY